MNFLDYIVAFYDFIIMISPVIILVINIYLLRRDRHFKYNFDYQKSLNSNIYLTITNIGERDFYLRAVILEKNNRHYNYIETYMSEETDFIDNPDIKYRVQKNQKIILPKKVNVGEMITIGFEIQIKNFTNGKFDNIYNYYSDGGKVFLRLNNTLVKLSSKKIKEVNIYNMTSI